MRWLLSIFIVFSALWTTVASAQQPLTNEEVISERIGFYAGISPVIRYLQLNFENAQTVAQKNEAVRLYRQFHLFYRQEIDSRNLSVFAHQMFDDFMNFDTARSKTVKFKDLIAAESSKSHLDVLLGTQTSERKLEDQIHFNQRLDPVFEPLQQRIRVLAQHVTEELNDPRSVDPKLEIYLAAKKLALKFTMFFVSTQLYYKPSVFNDSRIDPASALKININRFSSQLKLLSSVFVESPSDPGAFAHSELAKILMKYALELDGIDLSKTKKLRFGILSGIHLEEIDRIEQRLGHSGLPTVYKAQLTGLTSSVNSRPAVGSVISCRSVHRSATAAR